jgi:hypothetical protein
MALEWKDTEKEEVPGYLAGPISLLLEVREKMCCVS